MAQQQSFLPRTSSTASSALRKKLDAKSLSRISVLFASLGAFALLQNAGYVPGPGALLGDRSAASETGGRALTLEEDDVVVTAIDERRLQVAVNGITEGYYTEVGVGTCVDSYNPPRGYDYTRHIEASAEKCAKNCGRTLLLAEHRGFNYDADNKDCCCLYDDKRIPFSEKRKSPEYSIDFNGTGIIAGTDTNQPTYTCYTKDTATLGAPIESYANVPCVDDGKEKDAVYFEAYNPDACAEKCIRFKLFATHAGFTHEQDDCTCLFSGGEAPNVRKLSGSGARLGNRKQKYADRYEAMADPDSAVCYDKVELEGAPVEDRLTADTSQRVWINEFHYRNEGENQPFVEVIGPMGQDASDYEVLVYQGRNGAIHNTIPLSGTFVGTSGEWGFVTVDLTSPDIRKGKQGGDGIGLARVSDGTCLQLISYTDAEGVDRSFKASEGGCTGVASEPIGVFEGRTTPLGHSLQLVGNGNTLSAFTWLAPAPETKGEVNLGQTLTSV